MLDVNAYRALLKRTREGQPDAAAELIQHFEPEIRRYVRVRLADPRLRRYVDSVDICQSVFAAFFVKVTAGLYDLDNPKQLIRLLSRMAHNKIVDHRRSARVKRTDYRDMKWREVVDIESTPSSVVARNDLVAEARKRLSADESHIADLRRDGQSWLEIASSMSTTPEAVRKRFERAVERVCEELGVGG